MKKSILTGMLLCMMVTTNAQLMLDDSLKAILRPYRAKGIDTIITLNIPSSAHMSLEEDSLNELGKIYVIERAWLFYKKNHQLVSVKHVTAWADDETIPNHPISRELTCRNPAPFDWIVQHEPEIATDRTWPHIISYKYKNTIVYDERHSRIPMRYFIGIHIHQRSHHFVITEDELAKYFHPGDAENINYEYNTNSAINKTLQHLLRYVDEYDKKYFFPFTRRKNP